MIKFILLIFPLALPVQVLAQITGNTINGHSQIVVPQAGSISGTFRNHCSSGCEWSPRTNIRVSGASQLFIREQTSDGFLVFRDHRINEVGFLPNHLYYMSPRFGLYANSFGEVIALTNFLRGNVGLKKVGITELFEFNALHGNELSREFQQNALVHLPIIW